MTAAIFPRSSLGFTYKDLRVHWDVSLRTVLRWTVNMRKIRPTKRTVRIPVEEIEKFDKELRAVSRRKK